MFGGFRNDPFFRGIPDLESMLMDPFGHNNNNNRRRPTNHPQQQQQQQQLNHQQLMMHNNDPFQMMMHNPFSMMQSMMGNMNNMFGNMNQHMMNDPNAQVYSSSTVMSFSNTGNGAPKVYQSTTQVKQLGGVKETRKTVKDSEKGFEKVAISHHIGDKAHVIERQRMRDGQVEEIVNLENLDENEVEDFNREFESRVQHGSHNPFAIDHNRSYQRSHQRNQPLAIDDGRKRDKKKSKSSKH